VHPWITKELKDPGRNNRAKVICEVLYVLEKKDKLQESHDVCVRAVADELKRDNWRVKADVEGYEKPSTLGKGYVPDVQAEKKGCITRICEVATPEMFEGNIQKYAEFKNYCNEYDFHMYVMDKDGKRRQINPQTFGKK
jgi:hypothetical protein